MTTTTAEVEEVAADLAVATMITMEVVVAAMAAEVSLPI